MQMNHYPLGEIVAALAARGITELHITTAAPAALHQLQPARPDPELTTSPLHQMKHGETRIYSVLEPFDQFASKYRFEPDFEPKRPS
jgi:hypothetical protein